MELQTKLRGVPLRANPPDARYLQRHTAYVSDCAPAQIGDAVRVDVPVRYSERTGEVVCAAHQTWKRAGKSIDPTVWPRCGLNGRDDGLLCEVIAPERLPPDDPEVKALRAELHQLDEAWLLANQAEIAEEDERIRVLSAAYAAVDEFGRSLPEPPRELECLECGAVYDRPGHVESGGMSCRRCG